MNVEQAAIAHRCSVLVSEPAILTDLEIGVMYGLPTTHPEREICNSLTVELVA